MFALLGVSERKAWCLTPGTRRCDRVSGEARVIALMIRSAAAWVIVASLFILLVKSGHHLYFAAHA